MPLVYGRLEAFEDELLITIRERPVGKSILAAFGRVVLTRRGLLADWQVSEDSTPSAR